MAKFLRRFFLFFFSILACLFLVSLLMPVAAFAHTMQSFTAESSNVSSHMAVLPAATPTPITTTVPVTPTATTCGNSHPCADCNTNGGSHTCTNSDGSSYNTTMQQRRQQQYHRQRQRWCQRQVRRQPRHQGATQILLELTLR